MIEFHDNPDRGCATTNTDLFYSASDADQAAARRICAACPRLIAAACLRQALRDGEQHGMWAGYLMSSPEERRAARTGRPPIPAQPESAPPGRPPVTGDIVRELWDRGLSDPQIAARLGVRRETIRGHRRRAGLPAHYQCGKRLQVAS